MANRFGLWVTTSLLCGFAVAAGAQPADVKPPANDDCLACHSDPDGKRADGTTIFVDAKTFEASTHGPMACVDCHQDLAALTEFPHPEKLAPAAPAACATCHNEIASDYHDSIHNWAIEKAGLNVAPACADCHGKHDIKPKSDSASRVFRANVPATCGTCHAGLTDRYNTSVHAAALKRGTANAPMCADCHTAHQITRADTDGWRLSVLNECGSCHTESMRTYRDTFHGQVTSLGFVRVAKCADCHGAHEIHAKSDPRATVSKDRIVETCRQCHPGANQNFARYDPHADRTNRARNPGLFYAAKFMSGLLMTVFGFFFLHTTAWLVRGVRERRGAGPPEQ